MQVKKTSHILLLLFLISSCGSIPEMHYYMIDYTLKPAKETDVKHPVIIGIDIITTEPTYDTDRIVYRDSPFEVKFYNYHRW